MKKNRRLILLLIFISILSIGCGKNKGSVAKQSKMLMVENKTWYSTEKVIDIDIDENDIFGVIKSSVDIGEEPVENGQSNFGEVGADYTFFDDSDSILVFLNEEWILFVDEDTWNKAQGDISIKGAMVISYPEDDKEKIFGDLNDEEIRVILDEVLKEIENNKNDKDIGIEKVFEESGINNPSQIERAKSKIIISKP